MTVEEFDDYEDLEHDDLLAALEYGALTIEGVTKCRSRRREVPPLGGWCRTAVAGRSGRVAVLVVGWVAGRASVAPGRLGSCEGLLEGRSPSVKGLLWGGVPTW